jgi:hypothetical protein
MYVMVCLIKPTECTILRVIGWAIMYVIVGSSDVKKCTVMGGVACVGKGSIRRISALSAYFF